ncbi:TIGR00730 family Rossman fold protein [Lacticaseibacillus parakribbianus]|uniref:LOG family protein n=1 Tax=Lacticaseibacillus parakribbianus TaxID=2970927 RepID=UPI0021CB4B83|nr:TIGR00730 family Rossman fold protein [Lacticaseibacillus parakribbianus]
MTTVAIFCGAASGNRPAYVAAARRLGRFVAAQHWTMVYGGSGNGLMGAVAEAALGAGGDVIGIMPQNLYDRGAALPGLKHLDVVADMSVRKQRMLTLADGCIALPGGPGTLEEMSQAFSWTRIGDFAGPCAFYDVGGYWRHLAAMLDDMVAAGFLTATDRSKLLFSPDLTAIAAFMAAYEPPAVRRYR